MALWKSGSHRLIDFFIGIIGGAVAIGIYNYIFLIPYAVILVIGLVIIVIWAYRENYKTVSDIQKNNSIRNEMFTRLFKQENNYL